MGHPVDAVLNLAWGQRAPLDDVVEHIETSYGLRPRAIDDLDTAWRFEVDAGNADWVVRAFPLAVGFDSVAADAAALVYLHDRGIRAERLAHPRPTTRIPTGHTVLVTEFLEGSPPQASQRTLALLGDLAGSLAAAPPPPANSAVRDVAGAYPNYTQPGSIRSELENARGCLDAIAEEIPAGMRDTYELLRRQVDQADDLASLPTSIVHPDLRLPNIVDAGDQLIAFDWQGAGVGPRILPLGVLLAYAAALPDEPKGSAVEAIVASYRARVRLTEPELLRLHDAIEIRPLVTEAIGMCVGIRLGVDPFAPGDWTTRRHWFAEVSELARTALG